MMQNYVLKLSVDNPTRHALLVEQLRPLKQVTLTDEGDDHADLTIKDSNAPSTEIKGDVLYLQKGPLRLGEVMDRIHYALSGRTHHIESVREIPLGQFLFLPDKNCLVHQASQAVIPLTDKERLLLRVLYQAPNFTLDRTTLLKNVWQYAQSTETHTFETHLYRLRQKLEPYDAQGLITADGEGHYTLHIA